LNRKMTKSYPVGIQNADCYGFLPPSALQTFAMDAATLHSEHMGVARDDLPGDAVWVVTKCRTVLTRPIRCTAALQVSTWYRGSRGAQLIRDFDFYADGERVGQAVTLWIMYDRASGRILRPGEFNQDDRIFVPEEPRPDFVEKLTPPGALTAAGTHTVGYADLDINGHMNNARYIDLCCNALALRPESPVFFHDFAIVYSKESLPGETLTLMKAPAPENGVFVTGLDGEGKPKFSAAIKVLPVPEN